MKQCPELVFSILAICITIIVTVSICFGTDEPLNFDVPQVPRVQEHSSVVTSVNVCIDNYLYKHFYQGTKLISVVQVFKSSSNHTAPVPVWCRN